LLSSAFVALGIALVHKPTSVRPGTPEEKVEIPTADPYY
jgi:hypothetical protein